MPFLAINNLEVPVRSCTKRTVEAGGARRDSGDWGDQRRRIFREWDVETSIMDEDDAEALSHWLLGRGEHWSFDVRAYSDNGVGPNVGATTSALGIVTGVTKFSEPLTSFMLVGATGQSASFPMNLDGPDTSYTVSRWIWNAADAAAWHHHVTVYDATTATTTSYYDGAVAAAPSNFSLTISGSVLSFMQTARNNANSANTSIWIEDLVMVPYAMTPEMVTAIYTSAATQPFGRCPRVRITGSILDEAGPVEAVAKMSGQPRVQAGGTTGTWASNMRTLRFTLSEV